MHLLEGINYWFSNSDFHRHLMEGLLKFRALHRSAESDSLGAKLRNLSPTTAPAPHPTLGYWVRQPYAPL